MRILGLDPGTAIVGWAIIDKEKTSINVEEADAILTDKRLERSLRLKRIADSLMEIIDIYHPEVAAVEELYFSTNVKTALSVAEGRGVLLLICAQKNLPVVSYSPLTVKQTITGDGRADKRQIQFMLEKTLKKKPPKLDDVSDAIAIALTHAYTHQFKREGVE